MRALSNFRPRSPASWRAVGLKSFTGLLQMLSASFQLLDISEAHFPRQWLVSTSLFQHLMRKWKWNIPLGHHTDSRLQDMEKHGGIQADLLGKTTSLLTVLESKYDARETVRVALRKGSKSMSQPYILWIQVANFLQMAARLVWGSVRCATSRPSQNYVFTFSQDKPQEAQGQVTHAVMQTGYNVLRPKPTKQEINILSYILCS